MNNSRGALFVGFIALGLAAVSAADEVRLVGPAGQCLVATGQEGDVTRGVVLARCSPDFGPLWQMPYRGSVGEAKLGGRCLAIQAGEALEQSPLFLEACDGAADQQWRHDSAGRLVGLGDFCLGLDQPEGGGSAILVACQENQDRQIFLAEKQEGWSPTHLRFQTEVGRILGTGDPRVAYLQARMAPLARSGDQGKTWTPATQASSLGLQTVVVDRADANHLFAVETDTGKLLRSEDGAKSWRPVAQFGAKILHQSRQDAQVWYAFADRHLWISRNGGETFGEVRPSAEYPVAFAEDARGNWLLVSAQSCTPCALSVHASPDRGETWQASQGLVLQYSQKFVVLAHPSGHDAFYVLDDSGKVHASFDGGRGFQLASQLPAEPEGPLELLGHPLDPDRLWAISAGFWQSDDQGVTWFAVSPGLLAGFEARTMAILGSDAILLLATQGAESLALRSPDLGSTWSVWSELGIQGGSIGPLVAGRRPGLYYGAGGSWRTTDYGRIWQLLDPDRKTKTLVVDPSSADTFYAFEGTQLQRSRDGGLTLEVVTSPPGNGNIVGMVANGVGGGATRLVAIREGNAGKIARSLDGGTSWTLFQAAPQKILDLLTDGGSFLATTEGGELWTSLDGATWVLAPPPAPRFLVAGGGKWAGFVGQELWIGGATGIRRLPWGPTVVSDRLALDVWGRLYLQRGRTTLRSLDDAATWQSLDLGAFEEIAQIVADPYDPNRLFASTSFAPQIGRFADPSKVLVGRGRFTVRTRWRNAEGLEGAGTGTLITDEVVGFRFFSPERDEVVVKVLDGRPINGRFWVFVASLTHVEFEVEVIDNISGERQTYRNPYGTFASFADTSAFPMGEEQRSAMGLDSPAFFPSEMTEDVLLAEGRFELSVDWQTSTASGSATGKALAGDTAAFTFFTPQNVELWVNVIDGRPVNGHYWVFVGSLSNVGFRLKVRDTVTGAERFYENPLGHFASFGDTESF